ncbi:OLC1v1012901C1 [Oldenlandia corymbosa var. corymbosa]|uniref:OLC1v1012901C1 n=1 Tax=Oldenlandia corymbosa var. corymbosa TaxID=529605 RepID=A0AAV1DWZ1_OLDCO|nr:OLC1v1012901C1 [Oldenlandia corymbosa var. corymbosa]
MRWNYSKEARLKPHFMHPRSEKEIWLSNRGHISKYVTYAMRLLRHNIAKEIEFRTTCLAIVKAIAAVEALNNILPATDQIAITISTLSATSKVPEITIIISYFAEELSNLQEAGAKD